MLFGNLTLCVAYISCKVVVRPLKAPEMQRLTMIDFALSCIVGPASEAHWSFLWLDWSVPMIFSYSSQKLDSSLVFIKERAIPPTAATPIANQTNNGPAVLCSSIELTRPAVKLLAPAIIL